MELDKRIIEGKKPLTAFDVMESKFIGTDCYFSDNASDYGDLSNCQIGRLLSRNGMTGVFNATKNNSYANFNYCLPCEWVREAKKKKYRPYTMEEFLREYSIGESILKVRDKREPEYVYHYLFIGHSKSFVHLGGWSLSLQELFEHFESGDGCGPDEKWHPFGILEK